MSNLICLIIGHNIKIKEAKGFVGALAGDSIYCTRCGYLNVTKRDDEDEDGGANDA